MLQVNGICLALIVCLPVVEKKGESRPLFSLFGYYTTCANPPISGDMIIDNGDDHIADSLAGGAAVTAHASARHGHGCGRHTAAVRGQWSGIAGENGVRQAFGRLTRMGCRVKKYSSTRAAERDHR